MDRMLTVLFDDEAKAYDGTRALQELHREGSIGIYGAAVVTRDAEGKVEVKGEADEGPVGTAVGMMTGALVGMLGGPQGMVAGGAAGTFLGSMYDLNNLGVGFDYVQEVGQGLEPGKAAVVAEVNEEWIMPVDSRMEAIGGTVMRRARIDVEDAQIARDLDAAEAELEAIEQEFKQANAEAKEKMRAKVDAARTKVQAARDRAKAKAEATDREAKAKMKTLEGRMAAAGAEAKEKWNRRIAKTKENHAKRMEKLRGLVT